MEMKKKEEKRKPLRMPLQEEPALLQSMIIL